MSSSWSLVVPVLLVGLAVGIALVLAGRRKGGKADKGGGQRDRELEIEDARARQQELYEQLREADGEEREELEIAAARNLQRLEQLGVDGGSIDPPPAREDRSAGQTGGRSRTASPLGAFLGGVACAALIGLLIVWAQRDARPREDSAPMQAPAGAQEPHDGTPALDPQQQQALEQIASRVENDPTDVMARKQYAVALLSTGQFFKAFEQAEILLASDGDDPDGLYVAGMVRMRMGQAETSKQLLDRVVAAYPDHVPALTALGVLAVRSDGMEAAEEYWQQALAASGGSNPEVERLIATARAEMAGGSTGAMGSTGGTPARAEAPSQGAPSGPVYTVTLDLAPGASSGGVLFVSLRQEAPGPPAAVRRIDRPTFPMTIVLTSADSMLGRPLPEEGMLAARLDGDGSASTREEGEPKAQRWMKSGEETRLTLE